MSSKDVALDAVKGHTIGELATESYCILNRACILNMIVYMFIANFT